MGAVTQWRKMQPLRPPVARKIDTFFHREALKKAGGRWRAAEGIWYVPAERFDEMLALCLLPADPDEAAALRASWEREAERVVQQEVLAVLRARSSAEAVQAAIAALPPDTAHFVVRIPQPEADTPLPRLLMQAPKLDEVEVPPSVTWSELLSSGRSERCFEWPFHPEKLPAGFAWRMENAGAAKQRRRKGRGKPATEALPLFGEGAKP